MRGFRYALIIVAGLLGVGEVAAQKPVASDADGRAYAATSDILPPGFRGRIHYRGTHEGEVTRAGPPLRGLRTRDILRSMGGGRTREYGGAYQLDLTFDGNAVTGRYSGTGGIVTGTMSGTRSGDTCLLFDDRYGTRTEAECTRTRFSGIANVTRGRDTTRMRLEAEAIEVVDAVQEEQARRERFAATERERPTARPAPPPSNAPTRQIPRHADGDPVITTAALGMTLDQLLDVLIKVDATTWHFNRYVPNSVSGARYERTDRAHRSYIARGDFTFRRMGGEENAGWVRVWVEGGRFQCIEFHDVPGVCRPFNRNASQVALGEAAAGMMNMGFRDMGVSGVCAEVDHDTGIPVMRPRPC